LLADTLLLAFSFALHTALIASKPSSHLPRGLRVGNSGHCQDPDYILIAHGEQQTLHIGPCSVWNKLMLVDYKRFLADMGTIVCMGGVIESVWRGETSEVYVAAQGKV